MRCPVIVQRESKSAGALGGIIIKIDSSEVAKIQNGKSAQIAITSWTPRGKNLGHGWSRRIYP